MARKSLRRLIERSIGTEWERIVARIGASGRRRVLVCWNRGLGDVALGLCPVVVELRQRIPDVSIAVLTRADLADAFALIDVDELVVDPALRRRETIDVDRTLARLGVDRGRFDVVLDRPDPTHWFRGMKIVDPRLSWPARRDRLSAPFDAVFDAGFAVVGGGEPIDVGIHLQSETGGYYRYRKDWPIAAWRSLFAELAARHPVRFVLFGHAPVPAFEGPRFVDLRGRTSLLEMLAVIEDRCRMLIAPDSGVLTTTYYLDVETPIDVVSLWADPRQGVLKQGGPSPNPLLRHRPLLAPDEDIERLDVATVLAAVETLLASAIAEPRSATRIAYPVAAR